MASRALVRVGRTLLTVTALLVPFAVRAQVTAGPLITVHADSTLGSVSPLIFGSGYDRTTDPLASADPDTGFTMPATIDQIKDAGVALIRFPAADVANNFQWQGSVGPQTRRSAQTSGVPRDPAPLGSTFGPDEFGDLLNKTGAVGQLVVNFGTASAADAANFVAYMAHPIGSALVNGVDWASRRAANHHPLPYKIAYVDVGSGFGDATAPAERNYWMQGGPASINAACASDKIACLYAFGGATRFEKQAAVQLADWRDAASLSTGEPHQSLYARYAPVAAGSETVWIDGTPWRGLSDLEQAPADAKVYKINYQTGAVSFGDSTHGAIPPKGSRVSFSYTSGPHEGFVDYYRAIKATNPTVKVCAALSEESFIRIMGAQHPYDCIEQRPLAAKNVAGSGADAFFLGTAGQTMVSGEELRRTQQLVKKYAGANAAKIELLLADGDQAGAPPASWAHFGRTQGAAIIYALGIREWVLGGVSVAVRNSLTGYAFGPPPATEPGQQYAFAASDHALIAGPAPSSVVMPVALALKLLRQHTGGELLATAVTANPNVGSNQGAPVDALAVYGTRDAQGNIDIIVVNVDAARDIQATVQLGTMPLGPSMTVTTLASSDLKDENSPAKSTRVALAEHTVNVGAGDFQVSFPRHSVTAIRLSAPAPHG